MILTVRTSIYCSVDMSMICFQHAHQYFILFIGEDYTFYECKLIIFAFDDRRFFLFRLYRVLHAVIVWRCHSVALAQYVKCRENWTTWEFPERKIIVKLSNEQRNLFNFHPFSMDVLIWRIYLLYLINIPLPKFTAFSPSTLVF